MPDELPDSAAQAAPARLKAKAAARKTTAAAPPEPAASEVADLSEAELAAHPEAARRRIAAVLADLRAAFGECAAAKAEQGKQVVDLGWSCQYGSAAEFLKHLQQECERLQNQAAQTADEIESTASTLELVAEQETLENLKAEWAKLCREGVPRRQWPLAAELPFGLQFQVMAELERDQKGRAA